MHHALQFNGEVTFATVFASFMVEMNDSPKNNFFFYLRGIKD